jgi:multiple sugar transport system permease protein
MQTRASQRWLDWAIIAVMGLIGVFMLLPFAWLFSMSFRTVRDAYQMPPSFLPPRLDFDNYRAVLNSSVPFLQIYANSVGARDGGPTRHLHPRRVRLCTAKLSRS